MHSFRVAMHRFEVAMHSFRVAMPSFRVAMYIWSCCICEGIYKTTVIINL